VRLRAKRIAHPVRRMFPACETWGEGKVFFMAGRRRRERFRGRFPHSVEDLRPGDDVLLLADGAVVSTLFSLRTPGAWKTSAKRRFPCPLDAVCGKMQAIGSCGPCQGRDVDAVILPDASLCPFASNCACFLGSNATCWGRRDSSLVFLFGRPFMGKKLYVGNLAYGVNDSQLQQLFEPHGTVQSAQ